MTRRRWSGVLAVAVLAIALAGSAATDEPVVGPKTSGLENPADLSSFFAALSDLKAGRRTTPVVVLQIGDSQSAADYVASGVRVRMQAAFGEGGRGVMAPGVPYGGYLPRQVEVTQSPGWRVEPSFPYVGGAFGLSGWRLTSTRPGAAVTMTADPEARFDRAVVCVAASHGAGTISVAGDQADDAARVVDASAAAPGAVCQTFDFAAAQTHLTLTANGGPVTLLSFGAFRRRAGIAWSNLGVVGTELQDFANRDDGVLTQELAAYAPDLIVLSYGTNEGARADLDGGAYEALVRTQIARLHRLAPKVSILWLGPADMNIVRPDIPEDGIHNLGLSCAPLMADEIAAYPQLVAQRAPALARWYSPPGLAVVREAQRRAAAAEGAAFWDWDARVGGPCSAHRLSRPEVKLMRGDHIHFTSDGGDMVGGLLTDDLMAAYAATVKPTPAPAASDTPPSSAPGS